MNETPDLDEIITVCDQAIADPFNGTTPSDGVDILNLYRMMRALAVRVQELENAG